MGLLTVGVYVGPKQTVERDRGSQVSGSKALLDAYKGLLSSRLTVREHTTQTIPGMR